MSLSFESWDMSCVLMWKKKVVSQGSKILNELALTVGSRLPLNEITNLTCLDLRIQDLPDESLRPLQHVPTLTQLDISAALITNQTLENICEGCSRLSTLTLISVPALTSLENCKNRSLRYLYLGTSGVSHVSVPGFVSLQQVNHLL